MNIYLENGEQIGGSNLVTAIYRTDLVPIPITLELVVKSDDKIAEFFTTGRKLVTPRDVELVIVRSDIISEQSIKMGKRVKAIHTISILAGCEPLIYATKKAISLTDTSLNEVYRAFGAKVRFKRDIKLASFVCLKGVLPTTAIAKALQKESAVICHDGNGLSVIGLNELMSRKEPTLLDPSAVQWVNSPSTTKHENTNYLSIDANGTDIIGTTKDGRSVGYYPRADARQLQNLKRVLVTKARVTRQLDENLDAGNLVTVNDQRLVILTGAHRYDSGALGGNAITATKAWLAAVEGANNEL